MAATTGAAASEIVFSNGGTRTVSSILGGYSSTLAGVVTSAFGLGLKKSPTRAERRRLTFLALPSAFDTGASSLTSSETTGAAASGAAASLEKHKPLILRYKD